MQSLHHFRLNGRAIALLICLLTESAQAALNKASCVPFRVYPGAHLPDPPAEAKLPMPEGWEEKLTSEIARVGAARDFIAIYSKWKSSASHLLSDQARYRWLTCLLHYSRIDTDGDGIPDWTPVTDGLPSDTLMPFDPDMDGDGVLNALDSAPLIAEAPKQTRSRRSNTLIPPHLVANDVADLQNQLYREYGLLAINHTDRHSGAVLRELLNVLRAGRLGPLIKRLGNVRYLYAFRGHSARGDIAAYHHGLEALSIGGVAAYGDGELDPASRALLAESLAHEIGHAFLLKALSPGHLQRIAARFGGWKVEALAKEDFYAPALFKAHPSLANAARKPAALVWDIPSKYALANMHEWFAESFASYVMSRMDKAHALPRGWRDWLANDPAMRNDWTDYGRLSQGFTEWFESNIRYIHVENPEPLSRFAGSLAPAGAFGRR